MELKGIYGFDPNPKAEQPQIAPQTTEDLPGWMIAFGVIYAAGQLIVPKIVAAYPLITGYAAVMGIAINIVDPQPKYDPKNIA